MNDRFSSAPTGDPLSLFHPLVREWFRERVGTPTDIQKKAWPEIAAGRHVLATAPTGSGKTLTAFLWALDRLLTGAWEPGKVRVLYVSPLKALNADVDRNLSVPLAELSARFVAAGEPEPAIRTLVRSGDTPQNERRKMVKSPPEILITTPESLNILLTSRGGRGILDGIETVILDEIHAVAGSKRGAHLITAVDRLGLLSGDFQRIALSATVRPLDRIAEMVGGQELIGEEGVYTYRRRPVVTVGSDAVKEYEVEVRYPEEALSILTGTRDKGGEVRRDESGKANGAKGRSLDKLGTAGAYGAPKPGRALSFAAGAETERTDGGGAGEGSPESPSFWELMVPELTEIIEGNRSTVLFTNSRRLTEKLTRFINESRMDGERREPLAYSHHGSLSKEVRKVVEGRLKAGELAALVATSSLELGIDVGDLDEVVLLQTPPTVASAVQRIGRAGHRVGEVSRGTLYPTHGRDFLDAAACARAVVDGDIEAIRPIENPLDVLAQVILSMTTAEDWHADDLFAFLRSSDPFRTLPRRSFDLVVEMLAGRYADSRVRELKPRLAVDRVTGMLKARPGVDRLLYLSGGTIPDRGYYHLRLRDTMARLGELDEEFVWERSIGDTFTLGAQGWRIVQITHNDVLVVPARSGSAMPPFWRADERDRGAHLSDRVRELLELADARMTEPGFPAFLEERYFLEPAAVAALLDLLRRQRSATGVLPHRHRVLVEKTSAPEGEGARQQRLILHTFWGGTVNRPFALALSAALAERYPTAPVEVVHDNDCLLLALPPGLELTGKEILFMVAPDEVEILLRRRLESTGFFGAHFRQNAARALLLPKAGFRHRTPLWLSRQRSKRLLEAVSGYGDFPIVVETWRTCLSDEFDLPSLRKALGEVAEGAVEISEVTTTSPSPFADQLMWKLTNTAMYEDDTPFGAPFGGKGSPGLRHDVLRELVLSSALRPRLATALVEEFRRKVQRVWPGYAPRDVGELVEWVKERVVLTAEEWRELVAAAGTSVDSGAGSSAEAGGEAEHPYADLLSTDGGTRLVRVTLPGASVPVITAVETLPRLGADLGFDPLSLDLKAVELSGGEGSADAPAEARRALETLVESGWTAPVSSERGRPAGAVTTDSADDDDDGDAGAAEEGDEAEDRFPDLLAEWSRFYGPFDPALPGRIFGTGAFEGRGDEDSGGEGGTTPLEGNRLEEAYETLVESQTLVLDQLRKDVETLEACDTRNLETLLRWSRAAARPTFEALPATDLPLFFAAYQGLTAPGDDIEALRVRLEQLLGYPAPAGLWEGEILPARLDPYFPSWLDSLFQESDLFWLGAGSERLTFAFPGDLDLLLAPASDEEAAAQVESYEAARSLFPDPRGLFDQAALARHAGMSPSQAAERLWESAWEGRVTSDGFLALRRGIQSRFKPAPEPATRRPGVSRAGVSRTGRRRFDRWKPGRGPSGAWRLLAPPPAPGDALEAADLAADRARLLLGRYGVVFRELLARELPALSWSEIFRALRIMELSGEVLSGHFFQGISGPQFATHAAFRLLTEGLPRDVAWWASALDPASPCGLDLMDLKGLYPRRHPTTHVAYAGEKPVVVSTRGGKTMEITLPPDHPRLPEHLAFLKVLLGRSFEPQKSVDVETINGEPAVGSPYAAVLEDLFGVTREPKGLRVMRRY